MERIQLITKLEKAFPEDWWVRSFQSSRELLPDIQPYMNAYESALELLDEDSWRALCEKAISNFPGSQHERGKHQFFNLLNEAFAYEFLIGNGYKNVRLIPENPKHKTPDLSYQTDENISYCEVKTIGVSQDELSRQSSGQVFDSGIYIDLDDCFFEKLNSTLGKAMFQISSVSSSGFVYLIVHFDDFTLNNYQNYEDQLSEYLETSFGSTEIYIRVGILGKRHIHHVGL